MKQKTVWIAFWVYLAAIVLATATSTAKSGRGPANEMKARTELHLFN